MDSNDTMTKMLSEVDALVGVFVREDLKDEVFRDAKKQVETDVRVLMKRNRK